MLPWISSRRGSKCNWNWHHGRKLLHLVSINQWLIRHRMTYLRQRSLIIESRYLWLRRRRLHGTRVVRAHRLLIWVNAIRRVIWVRRLLISHGWHRYSPRRAMLSLRVRLYIVDSRGRWCVIVARRWSNRVSRIRCCGWGLSAIKSRLRLHWWRRRKCSTGAHRWWWPVLVTRAWSVLGLDLLCFLRC